MYETVRDLWKRYCSKYSAEWSIEDPRGDLAAEVRERLTQLDLVLDHLKRAVRIFAGDPERLRRDVKWMTEAQPRLVRGEITQEEYLAGFSQKSEAESRACLRASEEVRLFSEMFYFVAWRLREVLNGPKPRAFPKLRRIEAKSIRHVRNVLIEHPEHGKPVPNYRQWLTVTDDGPVLKSSVVLVRGGSVTAPEESIDRGLYVNADELRREMEECLGEALGSGSGVASS
jgi:hypothetical protein